MADLALAITISGADEGASTAISRVATSLDEVKAAAVGAGGAAGSFSESTLKAAASSGVATKAHGEQVGALESLGKGFASVTEQAMSFGLGMAGLAAVTEVVGLLGEALVGIPEQFEAARISFETFLGSTGDANALLTQLQGLGSTDPFHTTALLDVAQRLVALGTPAEQVASNVQDIATAVAAVGGTDADLQRVASALARISETGTVTSRTMLQLVNEQIPAWQILESGLGKTHEQLVKMMADGQITALVFQDAFHTWATSGDVADVLGKRVDTVSGSLTVLSNNAQLALAQGVTPLSAGITDLANALAKMSQSGTFTSIGEGLNRGLTEDARLAKDLVDSLHEAERFMSSPVFPNAPTPETAVGGGAMTPEDFRTNSARTNAQDITVLLSLDQSLQASYADAHNLDAGIAEVHGTLGQLPGSADPAATSISALAAALNDQAAAADKATTSTAGILKLLAENQPQARGSDSYESQTLASVSAISAQTQALMDSGPAATDAAKANQDALKAVWANAQQGNVISDFMGEATTAYDSAAAAAAKAAASLGTVGQQALASIPGLAAFDAMMFGTSQALAGVQLAIDEKVLGRMESRPAPSSLAGQKALLTAQLAVERDQRQVSYGGALNAVNTRAAGTSVASAAGGGSMGGASVTVNGPLVHIAGSATAADATSIADAVHQTLAQILAGPGGSNQAHPQLAGVR